MTVNCKTGRYVREQQPIQKRLKLALLFSPMVEWIDRTHLMRLWIRDKTQREGRFSCCLLTQVLTPTHPSKREGTEASAARIKSLVDFYDINMEDFTPSDIAAYSSFEDFFVRQHTHTWSRPIHARNDPAKAVVVADSRLVVYPTGARTRELWIKGKNFTIAHIIQDNERAEPWHDGAIASFRLRPQDYHRYHSPVSGTVSWYKRIPGGLQQLNGLCIFRGRGGAA